MAATQTRAATEAEVRAHHAKVRIHEFLQKWNEGSVIAWAGGRSLRYEDVALLISEES